MLPSDLSPDFLRQLELFALHSRRAFLGQRQGGHVSPRKGHGIEFSDYRQYELGDNPRHIDWGLYARTDRLYVKRFQEEEDLTALILLDCSDSMFIGEDKAKWNRARALALSLSYVGLMNRDTISVGLVGLYDSPRYSGPAAFSAIARFLGGVEKSDVHPQISPAAVLKASARIRFPGIAVFITDCLSDRKILMQSLNVLRRKNLSISVICVLGEEDIAPLAPGDQYICVDAETKEEVELVWDPETERNYDRALSIHIDEISKFCRANGINFIRCNPDVSLHTLVFSELTKVGLLR